MSSVAGAPFWLLESRGNASVHRKTWRTARKQADALEEEVLLFTEKENPFYPRKNNNPKNFR